MIYGKVLNEITHSNLKYRNITGRKIRYFRGEKGLNATRLAEKLNDYDIFATSREIVSIEKGTRIVTDIELYYIAKVLGVSINSLFDPKNEFPLYTKGIYDEAAVLQEFSTEINGRKNITGEKITEARKSLGMKQADLEKKMQLNGVYIRRLSEIEEGTRAVTDMELFYFGRVLGRSIESLYDYV